MLEMLPDDEEAVLNGHYSQACTKVARQVWLGVIAQLRVLIQERGLSESAPSSLRLGDGGGEDNEACCLWDTLQAEARAQIYSFVIGLLGEERQKRDILQELRNCARELFDRDNESLVERLCIDLGYIDQADAPKLCQGQQQAQRDPLELLQGSRLLPDGMSRYEALYIPDSGIDTTIFFSNQIYNANLDSAQPGEGWRRMVRVLENVASTCGDTSIEHLLQRLSSVLKKLFTIHTPLEYPEHLSKSDAWSALRHAWQEQSYYFSIDELQLVMALTGTCVRIYTFEDDTHGGVGRFHQVASSSELLGEGAERSSTRHVVYDGSPNSSRGHFSILLSDDEEWVAEAIREEEEDERTRQGNVEREAQRQRELSAARKLEEEVARLRDEARRKQLEDEEEEEARAGTTSKRQRQQENREKRKRDKGRPDEQAEKHRRNGGSGE
jgi:hypothetical protein